MPPRTISTAGASTSKGDPSSRSACARPVEGEANEALVKLIAKTLRVSKSAVAIQRGGQSRTRILVIEGLSEDDAKARLTGL